LGRCLEHLRRGTHTRTLSAVARREGVGRNYGGGSGEILEIGWWGIDKEIVWPDLNRQLLPSAGCGGPVLFAHTVDHSYLAVGVNAEQHANHAALSRESRAVPFCQGRTNNRVLERRIKGLQRRLRVWRPIDPVPVAAAASRWVWDRACAPMSNIIYRLLDVVAGAAHVGRYMTKLLKFSLEFVYPIDVRS
jgi:hypothetical protein